MAVDTSGQSDYKIHRYTAASISSTGERNVLVLLITFKNNQNLTTTADYLQQILVANSNSVNNYYKENSYNQTSFKFDVVDPFPINLIDEKCKDNYFKWSDEADRIASTEKKIDLLKYQHIIHVFPDIKDCWGNAQGSVGEIPPKVWIYGNFSSLTYAHELGHNLGTDHAGVIECPNAGYLTSDCLFSQYGDVADVMGGDLFQFNAPHKIEVGWLASANIQVVKSDGRYKIAPLEIKSDQIQVIKIPLGADKYYYLSYRQPIGFDERLTAGIPGV